MRYLNLLLGSLGALFLLVWRLTCRYRIIDDPRPALRASRRVYIYALLHAHQMAAAFIVDDYPMAGMLSRSADGDLMVPTMLLRGVTPVRGSSRSGTRDKGGRKALHELMGYVRRGVPVVIAVDGPRGPRNHVHRGVADLAFETGAPVLPLVILTSPRWVLTRAWDRFQIPKPFCTIRMIFGPPIDPSSFEHSDDMLEQIRVGLNELETVHDPAEAAPRD